MPAAIPAVVGIGSALINANASSNAAEAQQNAINAASAQQQQMYNQTVQREAPFVQAGQAASQTLANQGGQGGSLGRQFTMADFEKSPAYNFNMQQAMKAIGNSASARGGALGGQPAKDMINYATNMAGNSFNQAQGGFIENQRQNLQALQGQINSGVSAAGGVNQAGNALSQQIGTAGVNSGNAGAAGQMGVAKALTGALPGISSALMSTYGQPGAGGAGAPNTMTMPSGSVDQAGNSIGGMYPMRMQPGTPQAYLNVQAGD